MAQASDGSFFGQSNNVYRGSLAFINHPNPVEPPSVSQRHPLDGAHQLSSTSSNQEIRRVLHDRLPTSTTDERPHKRQKPARLDSSSNVVAATTAGTSLDLPKLPVRQSTKRLRIPPTLSGLHQPPPDAGILPKISTEKPAIQATPKLLPLEKRPSPTRRSRSPNKAIATSPTTSSSSDPKASPPAKIKRNRWTDDETACLLKGVARFGIGSWTKILNCPDYSFTRRTAPDLKDRFRVCCPQEYNQSRDSASSTSKSNPTTEKQSPNEQLRTNEATASNSLSLLSLEGPTGPKSQRKTASELQELGIRAPFTQNTRRKRKGYSQAEDEALLKGFERHGNAWAVIRQDEDLGLGHRKPTDLRDRFRTRYPKEYANAGLAPRPEVFPKPARRGGESSEKSKGKVRKPPREKSDSQPSAAQSSQTMKSTAETDKGKAASNPLHLNPTLAPHPSIVPPSTSKPNHPPLPSSFFSSYDDVFFGAPADDDNSDVGERITLDRGILDWASESSGTRLPAPAEMLKGGNHADSMGTYMDLPRQGTVGGVSSSGPFNQAVTRSDPRGGGLHRSQQQPPHSMQQQTVTLPAISISGGGALPSLASVTAGQADEENEQLELPSLVGFGGLENDARHFLGFDELLS